jgi:hypothetical protein
MFAVVAALAFATATRFFLVSWLGERVAGDLRRAVFDHVLTLSPAYFETMRTGDILSRMTADIGLLQSLIGSAISMGLRTAITATGALALLVLTSPKLAGIVVLVLPLVVGPLVIFGRRERRLSRVAQERVADLAATAEEVLNGLPVVQAFTHEPADRARFSGQVELSVAAALRRIGSRAALILVVILLGFGAITFALWVGGQDVLAGRMTGGELSAFVFYAVLLASSGATISELWGEIQRAAAAADRLLEVLEVRPAIAAPAAPAPLPEPARGRLVFEAVTFRYPRGRTARRWTASRSPSSRARRWRSSGPSGRQDDAAAAAAALPRPAGRAITLDGVEPPRARPAALRGRLALVPQDAMCSATRRREHPLRPARTPTTRRCARRRRRRRRTASSLRCRRASARSSARAACCSRAGSAAHRHRPRHPARPRRAAAGRGDQRARRRKRAGGAAGPGPAVGGPHDAGGGPSPRHRAPGRPHRGAGGRAHRRHRPARGAGSRGWPLCPAGRVAIHRELSAASGVMAGEETAHAR